jgi:hypothetical protein
VAGVIRVVDRIQVVRESQDDDQPRLDASHCVVSH